PREAVGLQLDADLAALRARAGARLPQHAGPVLDVVPVLVREHVRLGHRPPPRTQLRLQLVEEAEVDVDVAVVRAVERPHGRGGGAAAGLDRVGEEARARGLVVAQRLRPVRLHAVDDGDDAAVVAPVRVLPRAALRLQLARGRARSDRLVRQPAQLAEPAAAAEEDEQQQHDEPDQPAASADRHRHAGDPAPAAVVLDLRGVEAGALAEAHAATVPGFGRRRTPPRRHRAQRGYAARVSDRGQAAPAAPPEARGRGRAGRTVVTALALAGLVVAAVWIAVSVLPRWWSHRVGDQVGGDLSAGVVLGFMYGFLATLLPLLVLGAVLRFRRRSRRAWLAGGAVAL